MDIRWLEDFLIVAETGNFTKAAQMRNVSQAAFSRRIKTLEWWLGTDLIDRNSVPTRLTASGELFREQAAEIIERIASARSTFNDAKSLRHKQVRVALVFSLATGRLPDWWNGWSKNIDPGTICSVVTGNVHESVAALMTGSVDMLLCHQSQHIPITLSEDQYDHVTIEKETLAPYASPTLAAELKGIFPGKKGAPVPLLMYTRKCSFARVVDTIIENAPQKLFGRTVLRTETPSVLRSMAVAGHGVAWLTDCLANEMPGALRRVDSNSWTANLEIVAWRDKAVSFPALDKLWAQLGSDASIGRRRIAK